MYRALWVGKSNTRTNADLLLIKASLINVFAVRKYGESEFWLAIGSMFCNHLEPTAHQIRRLISLRADIDSDPLQLYFRHNGRR